MSKKETNEKESSEVSGPEESNNSDVGYSDLYPGRKHGPIQRSWLGKLFLTEKQEEIAKLKCEINVYDCVKNSPIIKLMLAALKSSGCEIDLSRHISCEVCDKSVTGGYDPQLNQVVICQNTARSKNQVQSALAHEMIHMFDCCRNKVDLQNLDHLACTEIRAASICHCSFLGAVRSGIASFINIKKAHQDCVLDKAVRSILAVQNVSRDTAMEAVIRVFNKCYNDLEPVGRRIRRNSEDMQRAYLEGPLYGYTE